MIVWRIKGWEGKDLDSGLFKFFLEMRGKAIYSGVF